MSDISKSDSIRTASHGCCFHSLFNAYSSKRSSFHFFISHVSFVSFLVFLFSFESTWYAGLAIIIYFRLPLSFILCFHCFPISVIAHKQIDRRNKMNTKTKTKTTATPPTHKSSIYLKESNKMKLLQEDNLNWLKPPIAKATKVRGGGKLSYWEIHNKKKSKS